MLKTINCLKCKEIYPFQKDDTKCPKCGSTNIEIISKERLVEDLESGVIFSTDSKGKRIKYKK